MSPRRTFQSWGSSSSVVLRSRWPRGVTRGSPAAVRSVPFPAGAARMLRNFRMKKGFSNWPVRCWRKMAGPGLVRRTAMATSARIGLRMSRPNVDKTASKRRFPNFMEKDWVMSAELPARDDAEGLGDTGLLGFGHAREKRQGNGAGEMLFGHGEHALTVAESFLVEGVQVKRYEVNGGANSLALEFFDDQVAADGQHVAVDLNDVDMPGVL